MRLRGRSIFICATPASMRGEREAPRILAAVVVGAERAGPVLVVGPADCRVRVERQRRRAATRAPRRVVTRGVRGREERGDRARLAAFPARHRNRRERARIETHRRASRQREEIAAARQRKPVARVDRRRSGAAHAGEQQLGVIEDASFDVAHEQPHRLARARRRRGSSTRCGARPCELRRRRRSIVDAQASAATRRPSSRMPIHERSRGVIALATPLRSVRGCRDA